MMYNLLINVTKWSGMGDHNTVLITVLKLYNEKVKLYEQQLDIRHSSLLDTTPLC